MKTYRFVLALTFLLSSSLGHAFNYNCIGKDKTVAPNPKTYTDSDGNTQDTDPWKAWKNAHGDWSVRQNWGCCENLKLEGETCKDQSLVDSTLTECSSHSQCSDGKGCYSIREDDLFSAESDDDGVDATYADLGAKFEEQQNTLGDEEPKEIGQACYRNMECESYRCDNFKCVDNKICREAEEGEVAPHPIMCEGDLPKSSTNVCYDDSTVTYYSGLLGDIQVVQDPDPKNRCQFKLMPTGPNLDDTHVKNAINLALATVRGMEWLYGTASANNHDECQFAMQYMREAVQRTIEKRKDILKAFNEDYKLVEDNFEEVSKARKDDPTPITTLCEDTTTKHDVAMRKASGLDFLCYMQVRNKLYKKYEAAMNGIVAELSSLVSSYQSTVFSWGEKDTNWTIGTYSSSWTSPHKNWESRGCRDRPKWHKKIKRRWGQRYKVKGEDSINKSVIESIEVKNYLATLSDSNAYKSFTSRKYFLLDPLLPGGWSHKGSIGFEAYGKSRNWNGDDDRKLKWNTSGYKDIHGNFYNKLIDFYKGMRKDLPADKFIYEPEIPSSFEVRGCADKIETPECAKFKAFINKVQDVAFAQMIAYSRHYKKKYKNFYNKDVWRKKLFNRYTIDLTNLSKYYGALAGTDGLRDKQNACLQRVIDQLTDPNGDYNGEGSGIVQGGSNYYNMATTNYMQGDGRSGNYTRPNIKGKGKTPIKFSLDAYNKTLSSSTTTNTARGSDTSGSGAVGNTDSAALAARVKQMKDANKKAIASGVDTAAKEKELQSVWASAGIVGNSVSANSPRGTSFGSLNTSGSGSGSGADSVKTDDMSNKASGDKAFGVIVNNGLGGIPAGAGAGGGLGIVAGAASGSGSGYDSNPGSGSDAGSGQDPTGMSDEEKDRMAANYERSKSKYQTSEDDSLFQVLSKTYVRNLDKILTRKKKLDEDSASYPSSPSTP